MQSLETMVLQLAALKEERRATVKDFNERIKELEQDVRRLAKEQNGGQTRRNPDDSSRDAA